MCDTDSDSGEEATERTSLMAEFAGADGGRLGERPLTEGMSNPHASEHPARRSRDEVNSFLIYMA